MIKTGKIIGAVALLAMGMMGGISAASADETPAPDVFTQEYLDDPKNIELGGEIWHEQCTHCHGFKAYPGKAPKLKPKRYKPGFVYRRVSKGFKKMPAWSEVYEVDEMRAIVAYVKSRKFSP